MEKVMKSILEHTAAGQIDKKAAAEVLELLRSKSREPAAEEPIAIIGIAARLPGADNAEQFWHNLCSGIDSIREFPEQREQDIRKYLRFVGTPEEQISFGEGGFLEHVDEFDYPFFRLSPNEASLMDPNQRLFMEVGYHALEDAGYGGDRLQGSRTGVYTGFSDTIKDKYQKMIVDVDPSSVSISIAANLAAMIPTRLSYMLDLKGPTVLIDTACSSGLVTVHLACQGIRQGDCDMAVAGAVKIHTVPMATETFKTGVESSDYRTRTFDEHADGAGIGEGCIAVVLKSLKRAVADGDQVYAVIKGSAINQDGTSMGITAPNPQAQTDVILRAWEKAGVHPETISYIETHGTGTELGDVIEIEGLRDAFARHTDKKQICAIGSVKPNIGHLYECAGMANLLKAVLALKHKELPPTIHFDQPNRKLSFIDSPVYINSQLRKWESQDALRCGVSSFGFSGTNCHLILEEAPVPRQKEQRGPEPLKPPYVLALSAKSEEALADLVRQYNTWLAHSEAISPQDLCFTANTGRGHYEHRLGFIFKDMGELKEQLRNVAAQEKPGGNLATTGGIYHGVHKIVTHQSGMNKGEMSEGERKMISADANERLRKWTAEDLWGYDHARLLCEDYVGGAGIKWHYLYPSPETHTLSLPLYPFDHYRCWLDIPDLPETPVNEQGEVTHYRMGWVADAIPKTSSTQRNDKVLILSDHEDSLLGLELADEFRKRGHSVEALQLNDSQETFEAACYDTDHLNSFVNSFEANSFNHIIYLEGEHQGEQKTGYAEDDGTISALKLFRMIKAIQDTKNDEELHISLVTVHGFVVNQKEPFVHAQAGLVTGLGKAIAKEYPDWICKAVDIDGSVNSGMLADELLLDVPEYHIAYRDNQRYVQQLQPVNPDELEDRPLIVREQGTYLITGGLGDIGLEMAKYLALHHPVRIALINRTPFPERSEWDQVAKAADQAELKRKIHEIREIEALGSVVECYAGDVSDFQCMQAVINNIRQHSLSPIHGVIHAAGIPGTQMLSGQEEGDFRQVLAPKVSGTRILDELLKDDPLDFFILFSSLATFFPAPGQGDYIAANAYLDAYSPMRSLKGKRTITINWPTWKERGMAVKAGFTQNTLMKAISTQEALKQFDRIVNKDAEHILIGSLDYESPMIRLLSDMPYQLHETISARLSHKQEAQDKGRPNQAALGKKPKIVHLTGRECDIYTDAENAVAQVWADTLGIYEMNIYSNYYEMGGDSVLGIRIVNTLNKQMQLKLHPGDLLTRLTVEQFAAYVESLTAVENVHIQAVTDMDIPVAPVQSSYPLSSAQNRMFLVDKIEGRNTVYNHPRFFYMDGELDTVKFNEAIKRIIARHDAFRTSFETTSSGPVQRISKDISFEIPYSEQDEAAIPRLINDFITPFELDQAPLFRMELVKLGERSHFLMFDMHHIVCDGVSLDTFIAELTGFYDDKSFAPLPLQYKDYAVWQGEQLKAGAYSEDALYWKKVFSDGVPTLELLTDYPRTRRKSSAGGQLTFNTDTIVLKGLLELAADLDTSLYTVLLAAFHLLLFKYSGQEDIVIGSAVMGRSHLDLQPIIGVFINMLPMRNRIEPDATVQQWIKRVRDNAIEALDHQNFPFEQMVEQTVKQRDPSRHPMFDVFFILQNTGSKQLKVGDLDITPYPYHAGESKMDVALEAVEQTDGLQFQMEYCSALFKHSTMEQWSRDYLELLSRLPSLLKTYVGQIELESEQRSGYFGAEAEMEFSL